MPPVLPGSIPKFNIDTSFTYDIITIVKGEQWHVKTWLIEKNLLTTVNGATAYVLGDVVSYQGSSYVALGKTTGNLPTDTANWTSVLAAITGLNDPDSATVAAAVWEYLQTETTVSDSMKEAVETILTRSGLIPATV